MREIFSDIYYTGVLNPNMRVFDVIMRTEYGTSYNSYIVKGSEKTAIIDGAHLNFLENFNENVKDAIGDAPVDYLVLNHTEPDHSGNIAKITEIYPDIEILCSPAAGLYIKNIANKDNLKITTVKDGDSVSLGDKTLQFINAPFLHWPDSMFTYVPESKVLFSCDFFGAHYCEPQVLDTRIGYPEEYWDALEYYYECIFRPFDKFVVAGLGKIKDLAIDAVCTSHGPVLTKGGNLPKVLALYKTWSTPENKSVKEIPIFYSTAYFSTKALAGKIREGILEVFPDAEAEAYDIIYHNMEELQGLLNRSDAFLVAPLTINKNAVPPVWELLAGIDAINIAGRPAALFGSYGWSGEGFPLVDSYLKSLKAKVYEEQYKIKLVPSEKELEGAVTFGKNFANSLK